MENTFAQRLINARRIRQISQRGLCELLNGLISTNAIAKYETGKMIPSSQNLIAIANALNFDVDYFFKPFDIKIDFNNFEFRKRSSLPSKEEASIKERISLLIEKYIEIENIANDNKIISFDYKSKLLSTDNDARAIASQVREDLNLGIDCISTPIEVLENNGIKVIEIDASNKFDGSCVKISDIPIIVLNKNMISERRRLTLFHELAHLILGFDPKADTERLCNIFANEILLPSAVLKTILGERRKNLSWKELKYIQECYGISVDAIMIKAKQIGIISEQTHKFLCIELNRNAELKERVRTSVYPKEEAYRFERLVYKALTDNLISISKASSLLNCSVDEINAQLMLA